MNRLHDTRELASGDLFHTVTSSTRSVAPGFNSPSSARSHPSIASRTFARSSSTVSPCETQPGKAGTSAQNPPSSALWINTFSVTSLEYLSTKRATSSDRCPLTSDLTDVALRSPLSAVSVSAFQLLPQPFSFLIPNLYLRIRFPPCTIWN